MSVSVLVLRRSDHEIGEIIEYGESPSLETGLGLLNSPSRVEEATIEFAAAGA